MTTATLVLLNSLHTAFVLSSETEKNLVLGEVDVAYQNLTTLETTITDLREKNASLGILNILVERVGVLRDVLSVETEKIWSRLVRFSEEGDIQLTIQNQCQCISFSNLSKRSFESGSYTLDNGSCRTPQDFEFTRLNNEISCIVVISRILGSFT